MFPHLNKINPFFTQPYYEQVNIYLQHVQKSLPAALLHAVFIHQDAAQVQEAGVWIHLVYIHHLVTTKNALLFPW